MDKIPMTPSGHVALTEEYRRRTAEDRPRIIRDISEARAHGDLSENAEYHAAKEQQSHNEGRIQELESILALAEIIDVTKLSGTTVKFGATVTLLDEDTEKQITYSIVGDAEADASAAPDLDLLPPRPCHDRQGTGRFHRGRGPRRRPRLRDRQGQVLASTPAARR